MQRREFLKSSLWAAGSVSMAHVLPSWAQSQEHGSATAALEFQTDDVVLSKTYQAALDCLAGNVRQLHPYAKPVLIEGSVYPGIWLECAPQEGEVYSLIRPDIGKNNHMAFFALQREDGYLPCSIKMDTIGYGQIQLVVPPAATAFEVATRSGDQELLEAAYSACSRYDAWLLRYRNTRGTGLIEGFCTYDTGHDNSPRWKGIPNRCPDADARKCPDLPGMPWLCPDLSASVYGGRVALAKIAKALGKTREADHWTEQAAQMQKLIFEHLYSPEDGSFYDLDTKSQFIRVRGDVISRVLGEHVVDQKTFEDIYKKQIHNPKAFWAPYPLPSIAMDDPAFVRPIPRNSWGGATQALTALRAPRWMEYYGKPADLGQMMQQWVSAISRHTEFRQQMDPITGDFTQADPSGYSPAALVFFNYMWRLSGVRHEDQRLEWNVRIPAAGKSRYSIQLPRGSASIEYKDQQATLQLNGKAWAILRGTVRLVTDLQGKLQEAVGISLKDEKTELHLVNGIQRRLSLRPNEKQKL